MMRVRKFVDIRGHYRALALAGLLAGLAFAVPAPASAATATIVVSGTVSCQWHPVVGVWVESGGGGSGWAGWQVVGGQGNIARYEAKIQNTTLPTNIRLHVGCGGSSSDWWSDNLTGSTSRAGGPLTGPTKNLDAVCNEGRTVHAPPGNNCWFGYASAAAAWAVQHLIGPGSLHAVVPPDKVPDTSTESTWSTYCLAFAVAAYWSSGLYNNVSPIVYSDAAHMYAKYYMAGLVHSKSGIPPVGAFAFYPNLPHTQGQGHIGISIGHGYVVTANEGKGAVVRHQGFDSGNLAGYYAGWAYPTTAFRGAS